MIRIEDVTHELVPARPYTPRRAGVISRIVLHHTATGLDVDVRDIHEEHKRRGWAGIGYHFVIEPYTPRVWKTRPLGTVPACVAGHNTGSICIAWLGDYEQQDLPQEGVGATIELCRLLMNAYGKLDILGHSDLGQTKCPGRYGLVQVRRISRQLLGRE